jgi:hypothetical protein
MICKLGIEIEEEQFVEVKHYKKKDIILSKGYYHIKCFRDRLNGSDKLNKIQSAAMSFINGARKKVGIEDEKEVILV